MSHELSDEQKQVFKDAAARRKAAGIKLGRFSVMADKNQIVSLNDFWNGWVQTLGKQHAVDYLIVVMRKGDEALRIAAEKRTKRKS